MIKKLFVVMVVVICAAFVYEANAVIAGNTTKLYWRDNFGAAFDAYVEAVPGDTIFVQVEVNNNNWAVTRNGRILAWYDGTVVDAFNVNPEHLPYAHLKDYRSGGGFVPSDADPDPEVLDLNYGGSNVYIYTGGPGTSVAGTIPTTYDYVGIHGADPGGLLLGFYVPVRGDAPLGSTIFSVKVTGQGAWSSGIVWSEELSDVVNTDWALEINVVPEPATIGVLGFGGLAALLRRRRK